MRIENPNYYGIAVIFNYHSSGHQCTNIKLLLHVVCHINTDIHMHMSTKIFYNCLFQELTLIILISNCGLQ